MKSWTVRGRIIAAFATVITIMAALGAVSFVQLSEIRLQAKLLQGDVLPGLFLSAQGSALAKDLLADVVTQSATTSDAEGQRAHDAVDRALAQAARSDQLYRANGLSDEDRQASDLALAARMRFSELYTAALADRKLDVSEVNDVLRPALLKYIGATDSLFELNHKEGDRTARGILDRVSTTEWTLVPAILLATLVAIGFAWVVVSIIEKGFARLMSVTEVMSAGDFRQRVEISRRDELGMLGEGINKMAEDLTGLIGQVQQSGIQVNSSATEIAATSKQQQATATEIAATTSEVGATASRISATSKELARTVDEVSEVASQTSQLALSGQGGLQRMEASMHQIGEASNLINSRLALLSEKAANIGMVVTTINKVADQTNLLSLNAAIEAEKAGEHGRGFAVVAREIRRLADQTAVATFDIEQLVKEMQSAVSAGVMGMDKFSEEVRRGGEAVGVVTTQLSEIIHQVQTLTPSFDAVNEGVQSQSISAQQISDALAQLSVAAQQTADSLRQSNMAIEQLNDAARGLQSGVSRFTLAA
ncbi:MAG: methyl-accepting chemotaxis protein [Gemmatimonadaceae bacterium]